MIDTGTVGPLRIPHQTIVIAFFVRMLRVHILILNQFFSFYPLLYSTVLGPFSISDYDRVLGPYSTIDIKRL
jgi:hypothetical protein